MLECIPSAKTICGVKFINYLLILGAYLDIQRTSINYLQNLANL